MAKDEIYKIGKTYAYKCSGCGKTMGGFKTEKEAMTALRLHQVSSK